MISLILTIIEAYILSLFLSRYLSLQKEYGFGIIIIILYTIETLVFNENAIVFSFIQPLILFFTLLICIYLKKKSLSITDALVCLLAPAMIIIADLISLIFTSIILSKTVDTVIIYNQYYIIASLISKILLVILYGFISYYFHHQSQYHQWGVLVPIWIIVFILVYLFWFLITNHIFFNNNTIYYCMLFLIIASILLIVFIYRIQQDNEKIVKKELEIQKAYYVQKNKKMVDKMYDDIQRIEHASLYNLSHIKLLLQQHHYEELNLYLDNNIDKMRKFRNIVNTDNPFFNYIINQKINELLLKNSNIKVSCILENKNININKEQVESIVSIIDDI
ncbi:MAG: hypothetical protein LUG60_05050, partial [Erysipelotrichaceae bacterium]|nr:hypothetical protein [Erysipelotrichaceae bacterium]